MKKRRPFHNPTPTYTLAWPFIRTNIKYLGKWKSFTIIYLFFLISFLESISKQKKLFKKSKKNEDILKKTSKASKDHMVPGPTYQPIFWALEYLAFWALSATVSSFCCHVTPPIFSQPQLNKRNYPTKILFKRKGSNNIWVPKILLFHK